MTRKVMNSLLSEICHRYEKMLQDDMFTDEDRHVLKSINRDMDDGTASQALNNLCKWLSMYYGRKVIILLDEYDTPMQEAYVYGYWKEIVEYTRAFFNMTFKTNPYLERAIMTGITRVSKESMFSDLNNLTVVTTTSEMYETSFGFTETEVFAAMDEQGIDPSQKETVKFWYDGFTFGKTPDIYNPWSVTMYLKTKNFDTHWANTSSNSLVGKLIREGSVKVKTEFEKLEVNKINRM